MAGWNSFGPGLGGNFADVFSNEFVAGDPEWLAIQQIASPFDRQRAQHDYWMRRAEEQRTQKTDDVREMKDITDIAEEIEPKRLEDKR